MPQNRKQSTRSISKTSSQSGIRGGGKTVSPTKRAPAKKIAPVKKNAPRKIAPSKKSSPRKKQ